MPIPEPVALQHSGLLTVRNFRELASRLPRRILCTSNFVIGRECQLTHAVSRPFDEDYLPPPFAIGGSPLESIVKATGPALNIAQAGVSGAGISVPTTDVTFRESGLNARK